MKGRAEVTEFLRKKWEKENGYRLRKELFAFQDNRIAVQVGLLSFPSCGRRNAPSHANSRQFFYEWYEVKPDGTKQWYRCYGLEASGFFPARLTRADLQTPFVESQDWTFNDDGLMRKRQMSGNDVPISDEERWFKDGVDVNSFPIAEKHL